MYDVVAMNTFPSNRGGCYRGLCVKNGSELQLGQLREDSRTASDRLEESEAVQKVHAGRVIDLKKEVHQE